jgi:hypothetical protein
VPEVGLEPHSSPCKRWKIQQTYGIRPDPTPVRPSPTAKVCTMCTPQNRLSEHAERPPESTAAAMATDFSSTSPAQRPRPLINQGWKDSWDGINLADGRMAVRRQMIIRIINYRDVLGASPPHQPLCFITGTDRKAMHLHLQPDWQRALGQHVEVRRHGEIVRRGTVEDVMPARSSRT